MRKLDLPTLKKSAAHYLGRYATSAANLEKVLQRRVQKWCRLNDADPADYARFVSETVSFCVEHRLVDDAVFAESRTRTLRARGWPARRIRLGLAQKGVERSVIDDALQNDEVGDDEAALRFARRRRLGPWRMTGRSEKRDRDIAAMVRAGFSLDLARTTIDTTDTP
jgi:regulatory protein